MSEMPGPELGADDDDNDYDRIDETSGFQYGEEDGIFIVRDPKTELVDQGSSLKEAIDNLQKGIAFYQEYLRDKQGQRLDQGKNYDAT